MRMMSSQTSLFGYMLLVMLALVSVPSSLHAADVSYGFIEGIRGGEAHINYRGPDGERDVICDVATLSCRQFDPDNEPFRVTDLLSSLSPTVAPDASSAVIRLTTAAGPAYAFLDLADGLALSLIPLEQASNVTRVIYSRDADTIVFLGHNILQVYAPDDERVRTHTVAVPVSLTLVSPSGDFVSWYSYVSDEHMVVDLESGRLVSVPSETPAYFEISENGEFGVFREVVRDEDALRIATLPDGNVETAFDDGAMIDDYIVHQNIAYFTTNEESPLTWSLFAYDPDKEGAREIDRDVAYTDFMRSVGDTLLYYKVEGARGQIYSYRNGASSRLPGQAESDRTPLRVEEEMRLGDVNGVLWDSDDDNDDEKPLIVWLHGGPQRQTSVGYHPFLSYAVYDEMLERFVRSGARVAKLDYTGSTGYGARFQKGLTKKVGVADVDDVREAIDDLTDEFETSDVFLVGNSYGGYLALKTLVEEPRLIDGVAAIAAVTDWDELIGTNRSSIFAPYFGGIPSTETNRYYDAAEIMDNLNEIPDDTPIVVAYGEKDTTVPTSQSRIFIAGAENDKNLTKVVFPDEEHIIRKRSSLNRLCDAIASAFNLSDRECSR